MKKNKNPKQNVEKGVEILIKQHKHNEDEFVAFHNKKIVYINNKFDASVLNIGEVWESDLLDKGSFYVAMPKQKVVNFELVKKFGKYEFTANTTIKGGAKTSIIDESFFDSISKIVVINGHSLNLNDKNASGIIKRETLKSFKNKEFVEAKYFENITLTFDGVTKKVRGVGKMNLSIEEIINLARFNTSERWDLNQYNMYKLQLQTETATKSQRTGVRIRN